MKYYEAVGVGVVIGIVYGIILWASMDAFALASYLIFKNVYTIPLITTAIPTIILLGGVLSYTRWIDRAENAIMRLAEAMQRDWQNQMDKEDDTEEP